MNIAEAKEIPLYLIVEKLGGRFYRRTRAKEVWYLSPFRDEKHGSFKIDENTNTWKDFGHHLPKGDVIDLICDYNNKDRRDKQAIKDALAELSDYGTIEQKFIASKEKFVKYSDRYRIVKVGNRIKSPGLVDECNKRNLPPRIVEQYLKDVLVEDTEKRVKFNGFAMENDLEGTEICAYYPKKERPFDKFKNCIGAKGITTYAAQANEEEVTAYAFSSKWDFITWMHLKGQQSNEEMIVYHGDSLVNNCAEYILARPRIKKVLHFKHMDEGGIKADAALALKLEAAPIVFGSMEHLYDGFKDLSENFIGYPQTVRAAVKVNVQSVATGKTQAPKYKL